jgi:excinuclease ABC subunit A
MPTFAIILVYRMKMTTTTTPQAPAATGSDQDNSERSLTLKYLHGEQRIEIPAMRRKLNNYIEITNACEHNLKNITVRFPLGGIVAITGVSGSGKSTLVKGILHPALNRAINMCGEKPGIYGELRGDLHRITSVEMVDQNVIGKNSRSNPATYVKAYDEIRRLYAEQPHAKHCGYTPSYFSFNIDGGRCPECMGDGAIKVSMQFLSDVSLACEICGGKRFKPDLLEVKYNGCDISEALDMTVNQAIEFFSRTNDADKEKNNDVDKSVKKNKTKNTPKDTSKELAKKVVDRLLPLQQVGLGYIKLGQGGNTLSGGESQRVKLAAFLHVKTKADAPTDPPILFIFDEPTTGLHFHDINKLLGAFNDLVDRGHSVIVVEHNMDVVKCADWVIDLGPEGGDRGGELCYSGVPEGLAAMQNLYTGKALAKYMAAGK